MIHKPFFPRAIGAQRAWFVNYKAQIAAVGLLLGMTPQQITAEQNACDATMIAEIDATDAMLTQAQAKVVERDATIRTQMGSLRPLISGHKTNSAYTQTIGERLQIIGSEISVDESTVRTVVKLSVTPQGVDIKFTMEHCESANIYSKRATETEFTFFKTVTHPHTVDTRPNLNNAANEHREYYVTLANNDLEVGIPSASESINL